jgi:hypothetical protein
MKLAILILLAAASFSLACQQAEQPLPPQQLPQQQNAIATPVMEDTSLLASVEPVLAQIISADSSQEGGLRFAPLSLKKRLRARAEVLLIPLSGELAAIRTQILQVSPIENPCSDALPKLYETVLRPVSDKTWLTAAAPFEVCVIYPVIASARSLNRESLNAAQLPPKVALSNITAALDTNNDQQPDVLLVEYCCDQPQADRKSCDLTCSAVYVRAANGQWRIAETQTPC